MIAKGTTDVVLSSGSRREQTLFRILTLHAENVQPVIVIDDVDELLRELDELWKQGGDSRGRRWTRDELHERKEVPECDEIEIGNVNPAEHSADR